MDALPVRGCELIFTQVRQNLGSPAQEVQDESQAMWKDWLT